MLQLLLPLMCLCCASHGFSVTFLKTNWLYETIDTSSTELTPKILGNDVKVITTVSKSDNDNEIELVADLLILERYEMELRQEVPPEFRNLPKIKQLDLDKNNFIYIKRETFSEIPVERVNLNNNEISRIEKNSFGNKIKSLRIMCNNLKTFNSNWFKNISSLEELNLGGNLLTKIEANLFKSMKNLQDIVLSYNDITTIGEGAFSNRDTFKFFYLPYNNLRELKANIFMDGKIKIFNFAINNNNLTFLSNELLSKIQLHTSVDLDDNPWQCKCWDVIKNWVPDYLRIFRDQSRPVCVTSLSFSNYCVPFVDDELIEHFSANNEPPHYNKDYYCT